MKNLLLFAFLAFTILGLLSPNMSEIFADKGGNGKSQGVAKGCDNGTAKGNPHCSSTPPVTSVDCTYASSGDITKDELAFALSIDVSLAMSYIATAEAVSPDTFDGIINNNIELDALNSNLIFLKSPTCF